MRMNIKIENNVKMKIIKNEKIFSLLFQHHINTEKKNTGSEELSIINYLIPLFIIIKKTQIKNSLLLLLKNPQNASGFRIITILLSIPNSPDAFRGL